MLLRGRHYQVTSVEDGVVRAKLFAVVKAGFDPNEPRGYHGRWTDEGSVTKPLVGFVRNAVKIDPSDLTSTFNRVPELNPGDLNEITTIWNYNIGIKPQEFKHKMNGGLEVERDRLTLDYKGNLGYSSMLKNGTYLSRSFDFKANEANHESLEVPEAFQGQGIAKQLLKSQVDFYKNNTPIDHIYAFANVDVGGYAWAKYGFAPKHDGVLSSNVHRTLDYLGDVPTELVNPARKLIDKLGEQPKTIWAISDITAKIRPRKTLGQLLLIPNSWNGYLPFSDKESMTRFNDYVHK